MATSRQFQSRVMNRLREKLSVAIATKLREIGRDDLLKRNYNNPLVAFEKFMQLRADQYCPKVDVAVGPFSFDDFLGENLNEEYEELLSLREIRDLRGKLRKVSINRDLVDWKFPHKNPRCLIAIEIENTTARDTKRLFGSLMNASIMGKMGIVVVYDEFLPYVTRLLSYSEFVIGRKKGEEKIQNLLSTVIIVGKRHFERVIGLERSIS